MMRQYTAVVARYVESGGECHGTGSLVREETVAVWNPATVHRLPESTLAALGVRMQSDANTPRYRSWVRAVSGPLAEYVSALLAVEFDTHARVQIMSLPHEYMTLTQWLGNSNSRFECNDERGMRSSLNGVRTRTHAMSRPGDFMMLRAFLTPLGAVLLARGYALPDINARPPTPWATTVGKLETLDLERTVLDEQLVERKLDAFAAWIERRMHTRRQPATTAVRAAKAAAVLGHEPAFDLNTLARHAGVTRRQLERDFSEWLAVSPRRFAQTVRLQRLALASHQHDLSLAYLASEIGFADQAHMNRAVRQLTGMTPRQFLRAADNPLSRTYRHALHGRIGYIVRIDGEN
jgi:AraC-like DNA-binding protein